MNNKSIIKNIIKFIIVTLCFYLLLEFNIFHIGENLLTPSKDYLEIQSEASEHGAAITSMDIDTLCKTTSLCEKIIFSGKYTTINKYLYTKNIYDIVGFIDKNSPQSKDPDKGKKIEHTISNITINNQNGTRRGYATWDTILFNLGSVKTKKEFSELSTHEIGHIMDLGYIQGNSTNKSKKFTEFGKIVFSLDDKSLIFYGISRNSEAIRKAETKKKDFCSGYGMTDPFEDFAECFNLYTNHNSLFRQIAKNNSILKKKYNFIAAIVDGKYINANIQDVNLVKKDSYRRPRDTTKITN